MSKIYSDKKIFMLRAKLGSRYIWKYLADELIRAHKFDRSPLKPLDVVCDITYNCNSKCLTCFRWASAPDPNELGLEDWKIVIERLKSWLGTFTITFSGGEPFLKKDMMDILRFASGKDIVVGVVSNGSLIDEALAKAISSSGIDAVCFSLNSLNPAVHNKTRGSDRSFAQVMSAIENLRGRGKTRLAICATVIRENINDLAGLAEFVASNGLDGINFQPLMEASIIRNFDKDGKSTVPPKGKLYEGLEKTNTENVDNVFEQLIAMKEKGYPINNPVKHLRYISMYLKNPDDPRLSALPCKIGPKNFLLDPFGNVRICQVMEPIGNVMAELPQKIWNSEKARKQREMIRSCNRACRLLNCNFKELDIASRVRRMMRLLKRRQK
ncbi:MAG: hypothetical protein A3G39_09700 [Deltaproteobacteria bacterium RIFCSPLOWO2_12_FULL_43_16]|nr:MAG: hypothetical protein A2Z89_06210 [Deltaproteobacteria bacterium GWA2_43_19]OGQ10979.1 MAG: hypothetical protein A3D30_01810 [Deltaproteobacteria bacterium RIFCSPHIGHO2_02_FULL_43_33]OGQ60119.1 MAG: hypothetical protein A3G39_09700 [Deltaproteobacteria bacterium RIFCSPLOWO2_12_FULL_43_16]HBR16177.1 hypothetical protein [Deltaproteobacteria bacterium]